jgi:hypothetical protein
MMGRAPGVLYAIAAALGFVVLLILRGAWDLSWASLLLAAAVLVAAASAGESLASATAGRQTAALLAGLCATVALAFGAGRSVLAWRFAAGDVEIRGLGILLGLMLLASLGGTLTLGADRLCPGASAWAGAVGRRALMLGATLGALAVVLALHQAIFGEARLAPLAVATGAIAASTWLLGLGTAGLLAEPATDDGVRHETRASQLSAIAAAVATLALIATGYESWLGHGSALAGATPHVLAATLIGIAAAQPTRWPLARRLLFLAGSIAAAIAVLPG